MTAITAADAISLIDALMRLRTISMITMTMTKVTKSKWIPPSKRCISTNHAHPIH